MKRNSIIKTIGVTAMAFAGLGLFSCSSDDVKAPAQEADGRLTLQLSLEMPIETRSSTNANGSSSSSTKDGLENENKISKVDIYFAQVSPQNDDPSSDEIFFHLPITEKSEIDPDNNGKIILKKSMSAKAFAFIMAGRKTRLYVVANYTLSIKDYPTDTKLSFPSAPIEIKDKDKGVEMPMTNKAASDILDFTGKNAEDILALLPDTENGIVDLSKKENPDATDLSKLGSYGTISLERTYARLDYKAGVNDNVYPLGETGLYVKVLKMKPVNVSTSEYLFRHTATGDDKAATGTVTLFGIENNDESDKIYNWIADTDWNAKSDSSNGSLPTGFIWTPTSSDSKWTTISGTNSNSNFNFNSTSYTPWYYVSENTLPSVEKMQEGLSTGVVFKVILCTNEEGKKAEKADLEKTSTIKVTASGNDLSINYPKYGQTVTAKFEEGGYCLDYYYWIRHNDKSQSIEETDPMEFAVVRNNIYQMYINKFEFFPREYNPEDPDEEPNPTVQQQEFTVNVKVLPWGWYKITDEI